jgi:GDP-L-fucose synthase
VRISKLAELMSEVFGYPGNLTFETSKTDGMPLKKVVTSKLNALGWKTSTPFRAGLNKVYQWFL